MASVEVLGVTPLPNTRMWAVEFRKAGTLPSHTLHVYWSSEPGDYADCTVPCRTATIEHEIRNFFAGRVDYPTAWTFDL